MDEWILQTVAEHGGALRRRDLMPPGSPRRAAVDAALAWLVATEQLRKVHRGLYALPHADRAIVAARAVGGALTCVSAAAMLDLPLRERPQVPHIALPQNRGSLRTPSTAHGTRRYDAPHGAPHDPPVKLRSRSAAPHASPAPRIKPRAPRRTSSAAVIHRAASVAAGAAPTVPLPLAIAHATRCLPTPDAVALVDGALNRGLVDAADLRAYRPRVGVVPFERALRLADGAAQSFPESLARLALGATGLTVQSQARVPGVGRVDFLVEGLVIVEVDGRAYHSDRAQFAEDRRRDRAALARGLIPLRFTYDDVVRSPAELVSAVLAALEHARVLAGARDRPREAVT